MLTSTLGIAAAHCGASVNQIISIGRDDASWSGGTPGSGLARTRITWVKSYIPASSIPRKGTCWATSAKDVALFRVWPPVTMAASSRKPSLTPPFDVSNAPPGPPFGACEGPPPGTSGVLGVFPGGVAGYGFSTLVRTDAGITPFFPEFRQIATAPDFQAMHVDEGGGLGVWVRVAPQENHAPATTSRDSGGPLFVMPDATDPGTKDEIGIFSTFKVESDFSGPLAAICDAFGCNGLSNIDVWADITAPTMKAWILSYVDPDGDGRWEGETDYPRTAPGTPGCDVQANPACDPGCDAVNDGDCDFVTDDHDNCPDDWNPDQYNTDDPGSAYDPDNRADPGDACDRCFRDPGPPDDPDCNEDAEVLKWGDRPALREDAIVGNPLNPWPIDTAPALVQNRQRYRGDTCDPVACMGMAPEQSPVPLGSSVVVADPACVLQAALRNKQCQYTSTNRIDRDGRVWAAFGAQTGGTGYRFCQCDGPFLTRNDRQRCLRGGTQVCPTSGSEFNSAALWPHLHTLSQVDPAFQGLGTTGETGTEGDVFTAAPKALVKKFDWAFWQDYNAIKSTSVSFPIAGANAGSIALDGLMWSNVREFPVLSVHDADLSSFWTPMEIRVQEGFSNDSSSVIVPGQWVGPCTADPGCQWAFTKPFLLGPDPVDFSDRVFAGLPGRIIDVTSRADPYVASVLLAGATTPGLELVPAAENGAYIATQGEGLPVMGVIDTSSLVVEGLVQQGAGGALTRYRSIEPRGVAAQAVPIASSCAGALGGDTMPASVIATLSATRSALFLFVGGPSVPGAVLRYDTATASCARIVPAPSNADTFGQPLAVVYNAIDRSLYAMDRKRRFGPVRILRIRLDGQVRVVRRVAAPWGAHPYLAVGQDGELVIATNHRRGRRFRVMILDVHGRKARVIARYTAPGALAAAPMLDERGLYLALQGAVPGKPVFNALDPATIEHPKHCPFEWVFK